MYRLLLRISSCFSSLLIASSCWAQIQPGGLHFMKPPTLQLERQDVAIGLHRVQVSYVFRNTSNAPLVETLVFPLPYEYEKRTPNTQVDELKQFAVSVNGQEVQFKMMQLPISYSGKDISAILKGFGVSFDPIAAMHQLDVSKNASNIRRHLVQLNLLDQVDEKPMWFTKTYYYWQQQFNPGKDVHIRQIYKPIVVTKTIKKQHKNNLLTLPNNIIKKATNLVVRKSNVAKLQAELDQYYPYISQHCPRPENFKSIIRGLESPKKSKHHVQTKEISYNFLQDDSWSAPINHFTLKIEHPANTTPMLCWAGDFKQHSDNVSIFEAENFVPLQNVSVLFLEN